MRLGFIGLGSMGAPMAMRLAAWPGGLVVHDLREEATEPLAAAGATVAGCVGDVAAADVIGVAVLDDAQVREVVAELARHAGPATVIAIHSTIRDTTAAELAARYAGERIHVIDAPVSGGAAAAEQGELGRVSYMGWVFAEMLSG